MFLLEQAGLRKESEGVNLELAIRKAQVLAPALVQSPHNLEQLVYLFCFGASCLLGIA